ncbi:DNA internalization-related competence protein ComEC/Rec2 [Paracidovorax citrulli]
MAADPWALLQAGFWLSFVAVGVLFASDAATPPEVVPAARGAGRLRARVLSLLREQGVVTLALTPLTVLLFGQISVVGFAANLVAIPWMTLVVTPLALLGVLWAPLWSAAAACLRPFAEGLQWLAAWPWATVSLPAAPLWAGVAGMAGGMLLVMRLPWALRLMGLPLLLPVLWWHPARPGAGQFELLAPDVGQGSAVLVRTAGHALLYDAGPRYGMQSDAGDRVLVPLLRAGGERLDRVMLSHRDTDHTGGAAAVLAAHPGADLWGSLEPGHPLEARGARVITRCEAGRQWTWDGVRFEVLHPPLGALDGGGADTGAPAGREDRTNAVSCVLRISAPGASALLAGDIGRAQEAALAARGALVPADVLLVPHHGSRTSSGPALLDAVRPRTAVVQAGHRNRYGHPAPDVLARYAERGARLVDSPSCGAWSWQSARPLRWRCEREAARRYWHHAPPSAASAAAAAAVEVADPF